ncbi:asparagine synthase (glutamine-hydrolyzing) [Sphingobacterium paucimobilis]|uniref:asparagine synthase (glutamine-hydrolyzing) n=1 Tax=Sphingobacterium paucimobilis HER1398 TaxID=1346330 RepID=U2IXE4_9SPHI|nr:asparagine synthase (glutamine-hydrolyzing) [Sphingobacterium paucimobilis]ERJ57379.1 hypothetical protein M472_01230 [Sphingobacterium paucimobilis HER1398]
MSGITGFFNPKGIGENSKNLLNGMLKAIAHRGSDGAYRYADSQKGIAMGHQYLHVNGDRATANPIFEKENEVIVTANGRFYDYKRTRLELQFEGHRFLSKNDNEIILPLYLKYGQAFVEHLNGEFAISLLDLKNKKMILARDRFGVKPLFYHIADGTLYWGSEIKSIFAHPAVRRSLDAKGIVHQLMQTMVSGSTAFKDIHAVRPGHMLIVDFSTGSIEANEVKYWDLDFPKKEERLQGIPDAVYIEEVQQRLSNAVAVRMDADVEVAAYLSGGIDSCAILGMASAWSQDPLKAFTISFDNADYDEAAIAKRMANSVGADHTKIVLTAEDLYGPNYVDTVWHSERTFYNTLGVAKKLMSHTVVGKGCRVALTGEGSDELFGGYPSFKRDMLRYGMSNQLQGDEAKSYHKLMDQTNKLFTGAILSDRVLAHEAMDDVCGFTPSWIQPWMQTLELARPLLHDDLTDQLQGYDPIAGIADSLDTKKLEDRHVLDKAQYTWCKTMLECQILNWGGDRVDMANGMESRPPFLDQEVVDMAVQIPPHLRINGNTEKWVLREAMKRIIPQELYTREKFAFMAPPGHTDTNKQNGLQQLMATYMNEESIREVGIFDIKKLNTFVDLYKKDKNPVSLTRKDALLNHILGLHILWHQFVK